MVTQRTLPRSAAVTLWLASRLAAVLGPAAGLLAGVATIGHGADTPDVLTAVVGATLGAAAGAYVACVLLGVVALTVCYLPALLGYPILTVALWVVQGGEAFAWWRRRRFGLWRVTRFEAGEVISHDWRGVRAATEDLRRAGAERGDGTLLRLEGLGRGRRPRLRQWLGIVDGVTRPCTPLARIGSVADGDVGAADLALADALQHRSAAVAQYVSRCGAGGARSADLGAPQPSPPPSGL